MQSAANNVINLEVPLQALQRALRTAFNATSASIRLTKRDGIPFLCLTIVTSSIGSSSTFPVGDHATDENPYGANDREMSIDMTNNTRERETVITQEIPIRVLSTINVEGLHEPRCREPDCHIKLPPLMQLKNISDRFTKLAMAARASSTAGTGLTAVGPRLELSANAHGCLRLRIRTDAMNISSTWTGLDNPELDPEQVDGGLESLQEHPSTKLKRLGDKTGKSEEGWATVRIDGRDWGKVMSVGRLGADKVIACMPQCPDQTL